MHPQTACQLDPAVIVYRFHPFFNRPVVVLRRLRRGDEPSVVVQVEPLAASDGEQEQLSINVPCWMLDQAACARVQCEQSPRIEVQALLKLRSLLDQFGMPSCEPALESGSIKSKGDRHERRRSDQRGANPSSADNAVVQATDL